MGRQAQLSPLGDLLKEHMNEIEQLQAENNDLRLKLEDAERCARQALADRDVYRNAAAPSRSRADQILIDELNKKCESTRQQCESMRQQLAKLEDKEEKESKKVSELRRDLIATKSEAKMLDRKMRLLSQMLHTSEQLAGQWRQAAEIAKAFE